MNNEVVCEKKIINKDKVETVKKQMIDENKFKDLSETFKTRFLFPYGPDMRGNRAQAEYRYTFRLSNHYWLNYPH